MILTNTNHFNANVFKFHLTNNLQFKIQALFQMSSIWSKLAEIYINYYL